MTNLDIGFKLEQLIRRVTALEESFKKFNVKVLCTETDWDNATLMQEWSISKRTAANYRKQGLGSFKRGGRVYYTPEHRWQFLAKCNQLLTAPGKINEANPGANKIIWTRRSKKSPSAGAN